MIKKLAYVGCRTTIERGARGKGIKVFEIEDGKWNLIQTFKTLENPSYLCFDNKKEFLYSVHGDGTKVSSYKILKDGKIESLNVVDIDSKNPVFIDMDKENKNLIVATLQGGALFSISVNEDGSIGEIVDKYSFEGKEEGSVSFAHQCLFDNNKEYIFVPTQARNQGYEMLNVLKYDLGKFTHTDAFKARQYAEPRHVAIDKTNSRVYLTNEKGNEITYLKFDNKNGKLTPLQNLPTIPETFTGHTDVAGVVLDRDNKYAVVSNRYSDIIAVFKIDEQTGYLKNVSYISSMGKTPRFLTFDETGRNLFVANEDSDDIIEFELDDDGFFHYIQKITSESPVCIIFKEI